MVTAGVAETPTLFARNSMVIVVPPSNPGRVADLTDLARPAVKVALCASNAPCGRGATQVFDRAGVTVTPVTREVTVKATVTKVELGEVDAGIVYVTDARASGTRAGAWPSPARSTPPPGTRSRCCVGPGTRLWPRRSSTPCCPPTRGDVLRDAGFERP